MARPESLSEDNSGTSVSAIKKYKILKLSKCRDIAYWQQKKGRDVTKRDRYRNRDCRRR